MDSNMDTNKVIYLVAVGVLALGLQSQYQQGSFAALHRAADQADCWMNRVAFGAEKTLVASSGSTLPSTLPLARLFSSSSSLGRSLASENLVASTTAAEMARMQAEIVREKARSQVECVREAIQERTRVQAEVRRAVYQMQQDLRRSQMRSQIRVVSASVSASN